MLIAIYVIAFILGLILIAVGAANAGSYDPSDFSGHTDNGVAAIVWSGAFLSLGITAAMLYIGARALIWQIKRSQR